MEWQYEKSRWGNSKAPRCRYLSYWAACPLHGDYQELAYQISNKEKEENARPALKDTLSTLNDIANATSDSEHLDGLGTRGSQSSYAQEVSSWLDRIGISNIVSGIEGVSAGQ